MPGGGYEDWYLLADFEALGALNAAAVDRDSVAAHDRVATRAGHGAGGVYALVAGDARREADRAVWLPKPPSTTYSELFARLGLRPPTTPVAVTTVWQRQLVLGPAPEFRLAAEGELALPADWARWDVAAREILGFDG